MGRFYQLERRQKMASAPYVYRYDGGGQKRKKNNQIGAPSTASNSTLAITTTTTTTTTTDIDEEKETGTSTSGAEKQTEMFPTVYYDPFQHRRRPDETNVEPAPAGVPIPQELEDRCHVIDRLWPALMAGQFTEQQLQTTTDSGDEDKLEWDWVDDGWSNTGAE